MTTEKFNSKECKSRISKLVDDMTLFDDELMSHVFNENIEATELLLRIIFNENIKVISVKGEVELKSPIVGGRNIILDVDAVDEAGREIDVEVQGESNGASVERARFHSSMLDARMLKSGQAFTDLKDSYVIFFYKKDKFKVGKPIYHIERYVKETGETFDDGSHIIYVNGNYVGEGELADLIKDFHQKNPQDMHYKTLAVGVEHFKRTEKGRENMSEAVEEFAKKYAEEYAEEYADERDVEKVKNLMFNLNLTLKQALDALGIKGSSRKYIISQIKH